MKTLIEAIIEGNGTHWNAEAIVEALHAAGYVIVPKKPTVEMLDRAMPYMDSWSSNLAWWNKMIGADQ